MRWPWDRRVEEAERKARESATELRRATAERDVARLVAKASREARRQNGFADLIRAAMGVNDR